MAEGKADITPKTNDWMLEYRTDAGKLCMKQVFGWEMLNETSQFPFMAFTQVREDKDVEFVLYVPAFRIERIFLVSKGSEESDA